MNRRTQLAIGVATALAAAPVLAQHAGHDAVTKAPAAQSTQRTQAVMALQHAQVQDGDHPKMDHSKMDHSKMDHSTMDHSTMDHSTMDHSTMDHSTMDHSKMDHSTMNHSTMDHSTMDRSKMDHSTMDHSTMDHSTMDRSKMDHSTMDHSTMDHSTMGHSTMGHSTMDHSTMDHSKMDHSAMGHAAAGLPVYATPRDPIPVVTETDRAAAFPPVHAHHRHGTSTHAYSLLDRLEISDADDGTALGWEGSGWIGGDLHRFWWRTEGHALQGTVERASVEGLYGRGIRAWWDVVAGVRHDFGEGPGRSWVGVGIQGLAPYKFEVSATAYAGQQGRTLLQAEAEYDTLLTNRWILQWRAEARAYGKDDPTLAIGSGLSTLEAGLRLRYEVTRQFAPYIGIEHSRAFGRTAEFRRAAGQHAKDTTVVAGIRIWF